MARASSGATGSAFPSSRAIRRSHTRYGKIAMPALAPGRLGDIEARIRARVEALVAAIPRDKPSTSCRC
ncbi:hypothetical protein AB5I41_03290 [Sphingomonas sp. MMS24-JH45]